MKVLEILESKRLDKDCRLYGPREIGYVKFCTLSYLSGPTQTRSVAITKQLVWNRPLKSMIVAYA